MRVSATEEHGLRCLMRLAVCWQAGRDTTLGEVARDEGLTQAYVAKLMSILRNAGLVRSIRGSRGGVALARDPGQISVAEALAALAGRAVRTGPCLDDREQPCGQAASCGLRPVWMRVEEALDGILGGISLADLVRNGRLEATRRFGRPRDDVADEGSATRSEEGRCGHGGIVAHPEGRAAGA
ncbi:MAG TPA: Rrf2 family transcriptional regulator [Myxococcota bacterium]|nr:Rrf2 family transcriptional regulator [Myxococcota bacterium]HQK49870.1 Rrf2 family transcriptional regulator [Myxococcota bacterium]